jgi:hypothetical protein
VPLGNHRHQSTVGKNSAVPTAASSHRIRPSAQHDAGEKYDAGRPGCTAGSDMHQALQSNATPPPPPQPHRTQWQRCQEFPKAYQRRHWENTLATYRNVVRMPGEKSKNTASTCATRRGARTLEASRTISAQCNKCTSSTACSRRCRMSCSGAVKSPCGQGASPFCLFA